jgi:hypothetical protein
LLGRPLAVSNAATGLSGMARLEIGRERLAGFHVQDFALTIFKLPFRTWTFTL